MSVILRTRQKTPHGKISLYLDIVQNGKRSYQYLKMYLHPDPPTGKLTARQKDDNKKTLELAEAIRSKYQLRIYSGEHGLTKHGNEKASFIEYFKALTVKRKASPGNYGNWDSAFKHLQIYVKNQDVKFAEITPQWVAGFKEYLDKKAVGRENNSLSANTKLSYFNKLRAALKQAVKEEIILKNPALPVEGFKEPEPHKEYLIWDEVKRLARTDCQYPVIKKAFLFACLTGIRISDISRFKWRDLIYLEQEGYYIRFQQQKTKGSENFPLPEQARTIIGNPGEPDEKIFRDYFYSAHTNKLLKDWVKSAGINKKIGFHSARHTFATLQLTEGTDLYTVSKLLGHKSIKTTQVYAKIIDKTKREAINRLPDLGLNI